MWPGTAWLSTGCCLRQPYLLGYLLTAEQDAALAQAMAAEAAAAEAADGNGNGTNETGRHEEEEQEEEEGWEGDRGWTMQEGEGDESVQAGGGEFGGGREGWRRQPPVIRAQRVLGVLTHKQPTCSRATELAVLDRIQIALETVRLSERSRPANTALPRTQFFTAVRTRIVAGVATQIMVCIHFSKFHSTIKKTVTGITVSRWQRVR